MIQCTNCGQVNSPTSNFCRFCGTKFAPSQPIAQIENGNGYEYSPPRAYVWKTDEFQVSDNKIRNPKQIHQVQPLNNPFSATQPPRPQPLAHQQQPQTVAYDFRCPRCSSQFYPKLVRKISTAGWIVFAILMVTFFPLFWIGLLIKEDVRICAVCNARI
jgi:RNA polymerase subunit RPABC4/transcription elongation factor Spt4